ncbi:hypothetical protein L1987_04902 [Smallanthus sonchifolius]|uniref:Uncharacterized protein n=1 Tax=Smallanthus sonchifolius TaxID=185202 RepID=A0ACB9JTV4_9ASTR|nr:hypothetical protein L1987_04902 [Smallanthus sonchifolius]
MPSESLNNGQECEEERLPVLGGFRCVCRRVVAGLALERRCGGGWMMTWCLWMLFLGLVRELKIWEDDEEERGIGEEVVVLESRGDIMSFILTIVPGNLTLR